MQLVQATPGHVRPFTDTIPRKEKQAYIGRTGVWVVTQLFRLIDSSPVAMALLSDLGTPEAFLGIDRRKNLWFICRPGHFEFTQEHLELALPVYRQLHQQNPNMVVWVRRNDADALIWYEALGYYEPSEAVMFDDYFTGPYMRKAPLTWCNKSPNEG